MAEVDKEMRRLVGSTVLATVLMSFSFSVSSSTLEAEAKREAEKVWKDIVSKCGQSYYAKRADDIFEMKSVTFGVSVMRTSDTEKMNGIVARAHGSMKCKVSRRYNGYTKRWGEWEDGTGFVGGWFDMIKRDGKWLFTSRPNQRSAVDCSKIPSAGD